MEFTVTEKIAASRAEVQSALADPAYYASLANPTFAMRTPELLEVHEDGAVIHTRVRYAFDGTLSGPASMVVDSSKLTWVIALSYDTSSHTGTLTVIPDHYDGMLSCEATISLSDEDGATTETVSGTVKVHVPGGQCRREGHLGRVHPLPGDGGRCDGRLLRHQARVVANLQRAAPAVISA